MGVGGREAASEGQSVRVRQDVRFVTRFAPVRGARTGKVAPFSPGRGQSRLTARDRSSKPASSRRCRISSCSRPHAPARDQIRNRRWAVDFDMPEQGGKARQAQPLTRTYTIAANRVSSGVSCVPPSCGRTFDGGVNGFASSHRP